ncbi:UbiA prenyltransferase family [Macrophomina phaseolina MS6]|uniref:UbiA prenyltransferase family n=1 Tax=Macrophomina phaseolina (strain MS6) TaxID=1126212 RepID=K2QKP5_MACPH|nr:UbiA prenyltransferase family [Macrophomina phaseolina MS6]
MLTTREAYAALLAWIPVVFGVTYLTLGEAGVWTFTPVWALSTIYPFMKRVIPFPQIVLGAVIGGAVFPGWASVTGDLTTLSQALPLFFATASWVVYFDLFYAEQVSHYPHCQPPSDEDMRQDRPDDIKAGVKSLAVLLGDRAHIFLAFLGILQVAFFVLTGLRAQMSLVFWVLGLGVWTANVIWHVASLDLNDRKSGGKIFKANIMLGLYMTGISVLELAVSRLSLLSLGHIGQALVGMPVM